MQIALFVFDRMTALDAVGPLEIIARLPGAEVKIVGIEAGLVRADKGSGELGVMADHAIADVPAPDILMIPGGKDVSHIMADDRVLDWIRAAHETSTWTTSICTGGLILAAAGVLDCVRATTHWSALHRLADFGAIAASERVVIDGKIATGAGVSAGIDLALTLMAVIAGEEQAQFTQLMTEYDPRPPFDGGSPAKAPPAVLARAKSLLGL
jgi:transcriptional regulator GlxA family with amidase domain